MRWTNGDAPSDVGAKVAFLLETFPQSTSVIETHMSWVFLTAEDVYKLKKPVRHQFLDHRTLDARRVDCEAEVSVNAALAPDVYLGTVPLTWEPSGTLALDGRGDVVDWLVHMRRLPDASMLDHRLVDGHVECHELVALVDHLINFYRTTDRAPMSPGDYRQGLLQTLGVDRSELLDERYPLDVARVRALLDAQQAAIETHTDLDSRAADVVDGHGDLRPEHVLVGSDPVVIDRITFDRRLRLVDPAHDLALLAVECELLDSAAFGDDIISCYVETTEDPISTATVELYRSLCATTRARLSVAHLSDSDPDIGKWLDRTDGYMAIAEGRLSRFDQERSSTNHPSR